jgi:hypothetical protein
MGQLRVFSASRVLPRTTMSDRERRLGSVPLRINGIKDYDIVSRLSPGARRKV